MRRINRRKVKHTLAVSTVIANMMMITITLGLAAILIAWTGSTYGLFASGAQIFYQQRGQAMQERFVVENVFFQNSTTSSTQMLVYVRNVGAEQINVVAIYVNGTCLPSTGLDGTSQVPTCNSGSSDVVPVESVHEYILEIFPQPPLTKLTTGLVLYIVIASARGNRATYTVRLYIPGT